MAFANGCDAESSSPYCICTDYYGNILPEYKRFNETKQTYKCCNEINEFIKPTGDLTTTSAVYRYLTNQIFTSGTTCSDIIPSTVTTDEELKKELPLLYYQALFNVSLFDKFDNPDFDEDDNTIKCQTSTIPYMLSYPNYSNNQINYKVLCGSSTISEIQNIKFLNSDVVLDYSLSHILKDNGQICLETDCKTKFNILTENEYNIGDKVYSSPGTINSDSVLLKWWFWFLILMIIFVISFLIYFLYYRGMDKYFKQSVNYLNNVKQGLGDTAKKHAKKNQKSHFHINT